MDVEKPESSGKSERLISWEQASARVQQLRNEITERSKKAKQHNQETREKLAKGEISEDAALDTFQDEQELDDGIDEILIALETYGLHTTISCRGHLKNWSEVKAKEEERRQDPKGHNYSYYYEPGFPFVGVGLEKYYGYGLTEADQISRKELHDKYFAKLSQLIEEFYRDKQNIPENVRLIVEPPENDIAGGKSFFGPRLTFKGYRESIRASGGYSIRGGQIENELERLKAKIEEFNEITLARQKVMDEFSAFLKDKFLIDN